MKKILMFSLLFIGPILNLMARPNVLKFTVEDKYLLSPNTRRILISSDPTKVKFDIRMGATPSVFFSAEAQLVHRVSGRADEILATQSFGNSSMNAQGFFDFNFTVDLKPGMTIGEINMKVTVTESIGGPSSSFPENGFTCVVPSANRIGLADGANLLDDFTVSGTPPTTSADIAVWKVVDENGTEINDIKGITANVFNWKRSNSLPITPGRPIYVYRVLTVRGTNYTSNKVQINISNTSDRKVITKVQGVIAKCINVSPMKLDKTSGAEIYTSELSPVNPFGPGGSVILNNLYLTIGQTATFKIENPAPNVEYRWFYMMEDKAKYGATKSGLSITALIYPVTGGPGMNAFRVYGTDGSITTVNLPTVNVQ